MPRLPRNGRNMQCLSDAIMTLNLSEMTKIPKQDPNPWREYYIADGRRPPVTTHRGTRLCRVWNTRFAIMCASMTQSDTLDFCGADSLAFCSLIHVTGNSGLYFQCTQISDVGERQSIESLSMVSLYHVTEASMLNKLEYRSSATSFRYLICPRLSFSKAM